MYALLYTCKLQVTLTYLTKHNGAVAKMKLNWPTFSFFTKKNWSSEDFAIRITFHCHLITQFFIIRIYSYMHYSSFKSTINLFLALKSTVYAWERSVFKRTKKNSHNLSFFLICNCNFYRFWPHCVVYLCINSWMP